MKKIITLYRGKTIDEIERQKRACRMYAELQGWVIVKEFSECGGYYKNTTDALMNIHDIALNEGFDILLVYEYSNLGRDSQETPFAASWFIGNNIDVVSVKYEKRNFKKEKLQLIREKELRL